MEGQEIIRAFLLEPGDVFKIAGIRYCVRKIEDGQIYYCSAYSVMPNQNARLSAMGANSREKLILITNKTKQNEHQNRSNHFRKS